MKFSYSDHKTDAYQFIKRIASASKIGFHNIRLVYEKDEEWNEEIRVSHISWLDYYYLKQAFPNISVEEMEWNEVINIQYEEYSPSDIKSFRLEMVEVAGEEISGTHSVNGNRYNSECDTYGPYYYSAYFLFQPEIQKYIVVEERNYAC
ncbi:hypothetical protein ACA30_13385 [Virgibacillus soli]|nr:hypothetical protein ACA30_13385 [Virgibacillus soli]